MSPSAYAPWVAVTGGAYFAAWSASFWPQTVLNARRRSVVGFSADFLAFNMIKHTSYATYNFALFASPTVQRQYRDAHGAGAPIPVTGADVAFSAHAVVVTGAQVMQYLCYERGGQKPSRVAWALVGGALASAAVAAAVTLPRGQVLRFVTLFSYLQLAFTTFKYFPQMMHNFRRKTCFGWSLGMVALDMSGSVLSLLQMVLQSLADGTTSNFLGDPGKWGLSVLSVVYDLVFVIQYCVYGSTPSEGDLQREQMHTDGGSDSGWSDGAAGGSGEKRGAASGDEESGRGGSGGAGTSVASERQPLLGTQ